jgi:hypothetical protein
MAPAQRASSASAKEIPPTQNYTPIPAPIPDTGFRPTLAQVPAYLQATETTTSTAGPALTFFASSIAHLSSLSTAPLSPTQPSNLPPSPTRSALPTANAASPLQQRPLSSTVIALLAVGSACLVLLIFIVIRSCTRRKSRPRLAPSLPIIDDEYLVDLESKESPIFGGKERLSPKIDSWITLDPCYHNSTYSTLSSALSRPARAAKFGTRITANDSTVSRSPRPQETASYSVCMSALPYSRADHGTTVSSFLEKRATSTYQAPYQQVQKAITQTIKRLSTLSSSLYPGSPLQNCEVGIALGGQETPLTGDGYSVMARARVKSHKSKDYQIGQSHVLAYDSDSTSTVVCEHATTAPLSSAQGGRTRIKSSYYAPGIHSRISATPTSTSSMKALHDEATEKLDSRRDKDRRSLTGALGFASSVNEAPLSPFTVYPDDSLSVVEHKSTHGATNPIQLPSPVTSDPGATLGTLLLSDESHSRDKTSPLGDTLTTPGLRFESGKNPSHESRIQDKPPRVPSPPPLPSLAQMAMEHHSREGFESYRSPTYSIYGLYGGERKSFGGLYK